MSDDGGMRSHGATKSTGEETPDVTVRRGPGFWLAYVAGWVLYSGLIVAATVAEDGSMARAGATVVVTAFPAAALGAIVAARRRDFFRPDRSLAGMAILHLVTGLFYAGACTLASELLTRAVGPAFGVAESWSAVPLVLHLLTYLFLYVLLAGFLMWTESIARVQETRALAAREAELRARAEARAIRAQFNPHFVFNTLHSLMLLVRAEPETAERAIENVAGLIRYAGRLQREERDAVPLEEELDFARRYLALEELRLEDRLAVEWRIDDSLLRAVVPAFALQTLLENAVKHGIAPLPDGGTIVVSVDEVEGDVEISVRDDGAGARPGAVRTSDGRGLALLEQRLAVLYGEAAALDWETAPGDGFEATVRVPDRATHSADRAATPAEATTG